jgi:hypothetical protein
MVDSPQKNCRQIWRPKYGFSRNQFRLGCRGAEINQKAAIESAKLQAISVIMSRMGSKLAQDIEKGMEMRY